MLCYVMLCYVMLCYVMLCYVMLCSVMLCYAMLCYVFPPVQVHIAPSSPIIAHATAFQQNLAAIISAEEKS